MIMTISTEKRRARGFGALGRAARALGALWVRATYLPPKQNRPGERESWEETLRFPPF